MANKTNSPSPQHAETNKRVLLIVLIVLLALVLVCCILIVAGILLLRPAGVERVLGSGQPVIPGVEPNPTILADNSLAGILDPGASPLFGSADLLRGFTPDPHTVSMVAGGALDTSMMELACGFTTQAPAYSFRLFGGASETFLRLYFLPSGATSDSGINIGLIVHTPDQEWLCAYEATSGPGTAPFIDMDMALSGTYTVWVGLDQSGDSEPGTLYITQFADNTP